MVFQVFTYCVWLSCLIRVSHGEILQVRMEQSLYVEQGSTATIPCSYTVTDTSYSISALTWSAPFGNIYYNKGGSSPVYSNPQLRYSMSTDTIDNGSVLTIASVQFPSYDGMICCWVITKSEAKRCVYGDGCTRLIVVVFPTNITLSDSAGSFCTGDALHLVGGVDHQFTCQVPDINPGASFRWTVGSQEIRPDKNTDITGVDGLITSTSIATLSPSSYNHGELLQCQASNKDGHPGINISVTLYVKRTTRRMVSSLSLSDSSGLLMPGATVVVEEGTPYSLSCLVKGTRRVAAIQWLLNDELQESVRPPKRLKGAYGLVDSTDTWSFTPTRDNHRQEVKCAAITAQSQDPLTYVTVSLDVNVVPISITLSDSTTSFFSTGGKSYLMEGVKCRFKCQVQDINPRASFKWMIGSQEVNPDNITHVIEADGLITSASTTTLLPTRSNNGDLLQCQATNKFGHPGINIGVTLDVAASNPTPPPPGLASSIGPILGVIAGVAVLVVVLACLALSWRKHQRRTKDEKHVEASEVNQEHPQQTRQSSSEESNVEDNTDMGVVTQTTQAQVEAVYANAPHTHKAFPRDQLKIVKELGRGAFGLVLLAEAVGIIESSKVTLVAVKTLKYGAGPTERTDMIQELELMKKIPDHPNVVELLGFCVERDPPYIIVEYLSNGNLKDVLRNSRSKSGRLYSNLHGISKSLTSKDLMRFAKDCADGMAFISSQQCIHRDLAARNVLMAEDMTCKVSDFGLARDVINVRVYKRHAEARLPLRWMALESVIDDVFTTESDVWSYGILLWEIVTLGSRPYPAMDHIQMIDELQNGYRMPKPQQCQEDLYQIMLQCWEENPERRPTFQTISNKLHKLMNTGRECISMADYEEITDDVTLSIEERENLSLDEM